ncbi:MAG: efflux RND transporter periplasmic adaptor subunit [Candidatus Dadabacteria bacterium]|nr:MAG: efflux RND transporter periplasmic adaptor subunit [Candidatus Dadabacteria bacterium]
MRTIVAEPQDLVLRVHARGVVVPAVEIDLVPEVAGRVVRLSPSFVNGGFFRRGEVLVEIDSRDYRLAVEAARAEVAAAEVRLAKEQAEADVARREWERLHAGRKPPPLVVHAPQLAEARAALEAARARLERAKLDLERTRLLAPFDGRVRQEHIDVGQYVRPGTAVGRIYSVEAAEVRLPLPLSELAYLELPLPRRDQSSRAEPQVVLSAEVGGRRYTWHGRIVRTEGEIDAKTRMIHAVARVEDPYAAGGDPERPPLAVGMFVEAEILGRRVEGVFAVPPLAMRGPETAMVVDREGKLRLRKVEVLRHEPNRVLITGGLSRGERLCVSPLDVVTDGMPVRIAGQEGEP